MTSESGQSDRTPPPFYDPGNFDGPSYNAGFDDGVAKGRATERRNVVAEIRKVQRYDLDGYPGAETFQPSASGDYVMADALDARLDELEGEDR